MKRRYNFSVSRSNPHVSRPTSLRAVRQRGPTLNAGATHPMTAHQVDSLSMFYTSIGDGKEGVQAFLDKRDPAFTSKASAMPPFYDDWQAR